MIPSKIKTLIDKYCIGVVPSDEQMDEIMDLVLILNADQTEVSAYIKEKISGPTKEEIEAAAKAEAAREAAEEEKRRFAEEEKRRNEEEKNRIAEEEKRRKEEEARKAEEEKLAREAEKKRKAEEKVKRDEAKRKREEAKRKKEEEDKLPYVDLGLSVKWAKCNLGASAPEQTGDYFAWGETKPKAEYEWKNYKFGKEKPFSKYQPKIDVVVKHLFKADEHLTKGDNKTILDLCDDAANVNLGGKWRIPSIKEIVELINNCTWTYERVNGELGYKVTSDKKGYTDKWIFLPLDKRLYPSFDYFTEYASSSLDKNCDFYSVLAMRPHGGTHIGDTCTNLDLQEFRICRFAGAIIRPVLK